MKPNLSIYDNQAVLLVSRHFLKRLKDRGFGPADLALRRIRKLLDESWYVPTEDRHGEVRKDFEDVRFYLINEKRGVTSVIVGERSADVLKTCYEADLRFCWSIRWLRRVPVEERFTFKQMVNGLDLRLQPEDGMERLPAEQLRSGA